MTDRDNITLPREAVEKIHEAWSSEVYPPATSTEWYDIMDALRTALAAEQPVPTDKDSLTVQSRLDAESFREERDEARALLNGVLQDIEALRRDAEQPRHPGYVIGSHWLETAYSRICAGEAEADVLRDCGWKRVDDAEALRRDAERYRYLRSRDPKEVFNKSGKAAGVWIDWEDDLSGLQLLTGDDADAAIDAAMENKP